MLCTHWVHVYIHTQENTLSTDTKLCWGTQTHIPKQFQIKPLPLMGHFLCSETKEYTVSLRQRVINVPLGVYEQSVYRWRDITGGAITL